MALLLLFTAQSQSITSVVVSASPLDCQSWTITVDGMKPMPQFFIQGDSYTVNGTNLDVNIDFNAPPIGNPMFAPYTHTITIPANGVPAGTYTLNVTTFSIVSGQITATNSSPLTLGSCCPAAASFTTNAAQYCWNDTIFITDQSAGTTNVEWYVNGVLDHSGTGDFSLVGMTGQVEIAQHAIDPGCTDSATMVVDVLPKPTVGFSSIQAGNQFTFTSGGSSAMTYTWDFGDGNTGSGNLVTHIFDQDGSYNVCMTTTDGDGCSADSCQTVVYSTVGLEEESMKLRMYPNPAIDLITVEGSIDAPIRWYNELGQEVYFPLHDGSQEYLHIFDLTDIPSGVYYIQWADLAEKVVIQ